MSATVVLVLVLILSPEEKYSALPISGVVVDKHTGLPVEGVSVKAKWEAVSGLEGKTVKIFHLQETKTDVNGEYLLDAWGPKEGVGGYISPVSPILSYVKDGYKSLGRYNGQIYRRKDQADAMVSDWDERVIEMERLIGEKE